MNGFEFSITNHKDKSKQGVFKFEIIKCAIEHCHPRKEVESSVKSYNSFHVVMHGGGIIEKDGKSYKLSKGDCFLLFEGEQYTYYPLCQDPWSYVYVDFVLDNNFCLLNDCGITRDHFIIKEKEEALVGIMQDMVEAFQNREMVPLRMEGLFVILLSHMIEKNSVTHRSISVEGKGKRRICDDIIIFINNNYRMQISMSDIAEATGFSIGYISTLMSKEIGWSPIQYLTNYRVANACELLHETNKTIKEISQEVGYTDSFYFSRIFAKIKGCSPREYRTSHDKDNPFAFLIDKNIDFR